MAQAQNLGKWGENIATDYLVTQGYAIVARNTRISGVEIDIIASRGNSMIFVEVKTRSTTFMDPLSAIDQKKIDRLTRAIHNYIRNYQLMHRPQIDIIAIIGTEHDYKLEHYPDVIMPRLRTYR